MYFTGRLYYWLDFFLGSTTLCESIFRLHYCAVVLDEGHLLTVSSSEASVRGKG